MKKGGQAALGMSSANCARDQPRQAVGAPALFFYASADRKNKVVTAGLSFGIRSDVLASLSCAQRPLSS